MGRIFPVQKYTIRYPGVKVKEIVQVENPNYLFIYLNITDQQNPV